MKVWTLMMPLALLGCAVSPQAIRPSDDPSAACFTRMHADPKFDALRPKIGSPAGVRDLTLEMMSRSDFVTPEDRVLISAWAFERQQCADVGAAFRATWGPPGYSQTFNSLQSKVLDLLQALYTGKINFGEFNTSRKHLADEAERRFADISQEQAAKQDAHRREAANTLLLMQALQPKPVAPSTPAIRPTVNCTTQYIGATAYTSCQ